MGHVKPFRVSEEHVKFIRQTRFINGIERSIRSAARTYNMLYPTLRARLHGRQTRTEANRGRKLLSVQEEKAIVCFCETLDDLGHPVTVKILGQFAQPPS